MKKSLENKNNPHYKEEKNIDVFTFTIHILAIIICIINMVVNYTMNLKTSIYNGVFLITGISIAMVIYFKYKQYALGAYTSVIVSTIGVSVALFLEGRLSFNFLYYFSIILSLPLLIKRNKNYIKHNYILFFIVTLIAVITIIISPAYPKYKFLTLDDIYNKMILNATVGMASAAMFTIFLVYAGQNFFVSFLKGKKFAESEKDKRLIALTSLGHELRTQITSINGVTQLITEQKNEDRPNKELINKYATILNNCNEQMLNLVNNVLDIHKIESGKFELLEKPENLNFILINICDEFNLSAQKKSLIFNKEIDSSIANLNLVFDKLRFIQILKNFLSNAIKYTEKGSITFMAHITKETGKEASILFKIIDTGIGISEENYSKIFESFQQIKSDTSDIYGGAGMGLSLTKTILNKMQSNIKIENNNNQGSVFSFQIDFCKTSEENTSQNLELCIENKSCLKDINILIADDNKVTLLFADTLLKNYKANTFLANNGVEALDIVKTHNEIDIILLDLEMPKLNGLEAIKQIKTLYPEQTIIAFTANIPSEELIKKLYRHGFDDFITKPFKKEDLIKTIYLNCK